MALSDPTQKIVDRIRDADAALLAEDFQTALDIQAELAAGDMMERFGADVVDMAVKRKRAELNEVAA